MADFFATYFRTVIVLTPFFVLTMFIALTEHYAAAEKRKLALRMTATVLFVVLCVFFGGRWIFSALGVTLQAFQIGAGVLLFLTAISLVQGSTGGQQAAEETDPAIVPLAIPITVGPGTIGTLMVMGANVNQTSVKLLDSGAIILATLTVCLLLFLSRSIEQVLGRTRLIVLSKLTGLLLASLAAQMIFTGVRHYLVR